MSPAPFGGHTKESNRMKTVNTYTLPARRFEDFDDCLAAACEEIAKKLDVELWQTNARWDDEMRDAVVVTVHGN